MNLNNNYIMYDLRLNVKNYLKLPEERMKNLFENFDKAHIHISLNATQYQFGSLEGRDGEKLHFFTEKLLTLE